MKLFSQNKTQTAISISKEIRTKKKGSRLKIVEAWLEKQLKGRASSAVQLCNKLAMKFIQRQKSREKSQEG